MLLHEMWDTLIVSGLAASVDQIVENSLKAIVTAILLFYTLSLTQPSPTLEAALAQRLAAVPADSPSFHREVGRTANADGAVVYAETVDRATGQAYPGLIDWIIGIHQNGSWQVFLPGDAGYAAAFEQLPLSIRLAADSTPYKPAADPAYAPISPYALPFANGAYGTVTRSFDAHGRGQLDFDLTGLEIAAAQDGQIIYANDTAAVNGYTTGAWWYWNVIIIQHAPHEYSLYGHLAPDSIPRWIKDQCTDDYHAANCAVPVRAGDVIAREGSTGTSSAPHLHVEFGQEYAVAAYMDGLDADHDGDRLEPIYGGYVYAEQNVAISGYSADEAAGWPYGTVLQAVHNPMLADETNIIRNGDFAAGTDGWTPSGWVNWAVRDGVLRATRLRSAEAPDWGGFYQTLTDGVWAHTTFDLTLRLGNDSAIDKTVSVGLTNGLDGVWTEIPLAANTPLQPYTLTLTVPDAWATVRLMFLINPADSAPAALVDDVVLVLRP